MNRENLGMPSKAKTLMFFVRFRYSHTPHRYCYEFQRLMSHFKGKSTRRSVVDAAALPTWALSAPAAGSSGGSDSSAAEDTASSFSIDDELNQKLVIWRGDITRLNIGAIVNAANKNLAPGGGICGAIFAGAGPELEDACDDLNGCPTGSAKVTPGFHLPCDHIIHAVGPIYKSREAATSQELLSSCYSTCLNLAVENSIRSLAFCCISTGIYGYPKEDAAFVAFGTIRSW